MSKPVIYTISGVATVYFATLWGVVPGLALGVMLGMILLLFRYNRLAAKASSGQESTLAEIRANQTNTFSKLKNAGIDIDSIQPMIGRDIGLKDITNQIFRVWQFDPGQTEMKDNDQVVPKDYTSPYGELLVESPILNYKATLPITHRDDFALASLAFENSILLSKLNSEVELLVCYSPRHQLPFGMHGTSHALHFAVVPIGTLEKYYGLQDGAMMDHPQPDLIFGKFKWGESVSIVSNDSPSV